MKQFDEKFSRKAKEAFENYNADHLAGEGWNSYLNKQGKRRTRAAIIPLWAKVASAAAILTFVVLLTNRINNRTADDSGNQLAQETRSELTEAALSKEDTTSASPEITATKSVTPSAGTVIVSPDQTSEVTVSKAGQSLHAGMEKTGYQFSEPPGPVLAEAVKTDGSLLTDTARVERPFLTEASLTEGTVLAGTTNVAAMSAGMNLPDNPVEIRLADDADTGIKLRPKEADPVLADIPREKMTTTIMGGLSGMMAGIDNATSASQGVSIGFYVEQQLTRRISVRPGLAMAKHNYIMESMSGENNAMDYSAPELNGMRGTTTSYDADMDVVSMEVPVNVVFSLRKRARSNLFVTTGASTVIYLSQHISGSFNNTYTRSTVDVSTGQVSYESMTTVVMIETEQEPLNRVDILGLANFSAGYSIPFGKTSQLLFEPFVQLPLKDLTSLNMRIRYGGLSMKLQF
jgi:hypothetical protein